MGDRFFLTREGMEAYRAHYLPDPADYGDVRASPVLCEDLDGLAPAVVVTAGFDPLRDEGATYAGAMAGAGVAVEYRCYDDMVHGFFGMGVVPDCLALATEVCDAMGSVMRRVTLHRGD
jgi:acetyl esterase